LPRGVVGFADADAAGRELQHPRAFTALHDAPPRRRAERIHSAPHAKREDVIAVIARNLLRALPATMLGFGL
jgi:hypothetical protein